MSKYYEYCPIRHSCEEHAQTCADADTKVFGRKIYAYPDPDGSGHWWTNDEPAEKHSADTDTEP